MSRPRKSFRIPYDSIHLVSFNLPFQAGQKIHTKDDNHDEPGQEYIILKIHPRLKQVTARKA